VEIVAEGKADAVEAFTAWCYTGPVDAEVKDIYIETMVPREMKGFIVG
jgi:acylphosphatase